MVLAPNYLFSWNNKYSKYNEYNVVTTFIRFFSSYAHLLCACWHLEAMKGSSSLTSCRLLILSRLLSSPVWAQLTLLVPALGIRPPLSQDGVPIHWVRAHSLTEIQNIYSAVTATFWQQKNYFWRYVLRSIFWLCAERYMLYSMFEEKKITLRGEKAKLGVEKTRLREKTNDKYHKVYLSCQFWAIYS